jgi:excisionase family DNA binding protein
MEQFYTVEEVATALKVTRQTIYRWMQAGDLHYVMAGDRRRIPQSALNAFLKEGRPEETEDEPTNKTRPAPCSSLRNNRKETGRT